MFDGIIVNEESRSLAETTYLRKRMYYNMRMKILKRTIAGNIQQLSSDFANYESDFNDRLLPLLKQEKELAYLLERHKEGYKNCFSLATEIDDEEISEMIHEKHEAVHGIIDQRTRFWKENARKLLYYKAEFANMKESLLRRFSIELETGGNVKIEEGTPQDGWVNSCYDLLRSRFFPPEYHQLNIESFVIKKIYRVQSRFLRTKYDATMEACIDPGDQSSKRHIEYLFQLLPSANIGDWISILEEGPTANDNPDGDEGVELQNSMNGLDVGNLKRVTFEERTTTRYLVMNRVLLSKVAGERRPGRPTSARSTPSSAQPPITSPYVKKADYPGYTAVYRALPGDSRQRVWFVLQQDLILPEYIVEYQYTVDAFDRSIQERTPDVSSLAFDRPSSMLSSRPSSSNRPRSAGGGTQYNHDAFLAYLRNSYERFSSDLRPVYDTTEEQYRQSIIAMPPSFKFDGNMPFLSPESLSSAGCSDAAGLICLHLSSVKMSEIRSADFLKQLKRLTLSFNQISSIEGLNSLPALEYLDLSYNAVQKISGLQGLPALAVLNLCSNNLVIMDDINYLKKYVGDLRELQLRKNPLSEAQDYLSFVLRRFPKLQSLDGEPISKESRNDAMESSSAITSALIKENSFTQIRSSVYATSKKESSVSIPPGKGVDTWWLGIVELDLNNKRIRKIQNLERLVNLRKLDLSGNEISKIEGLDMCGQIEDLNLEGNKIAKIEGLDALTGLKKLEIGNNLITSLDGLKHRSLTQLAVDNNQISSLTPLSTLESLLELYIGNNSIKQLKEFLVMKQLPKILILDAAGNPVCKEASYRHYLIYHVRKLKIIDGTGVEQAESDEALVKFSGQLTIDILKEKIGHANIDQIQLLDVSNCGIRDIEPWSKDEFKSLTELNLEKNALENLSGIVNLPQLAVLRLSHNRIETSGCCRFNEKPNRSWGFCSLQNLQYLYMPHNAIASISVAQFSYLINLRVLDLEGNNITKIDGLDDLQLLQELNLSKNKIRTFDGQSIQHLPHLHKLYLDENAIKMCSNMQLITQLTTLSLSNNRISDLSELENFEFCSISDIFISQNAVTRKPMFRLVFLCKAPHLMSIDGKLVTPEERERADSLMESDATATTANTAEPAKPPPAGKVSIRVQSIGFDQMSGTQADFARQGEGKQSSATSKTGVPRSGIPPRKSTR